MGMKRAFTDPRMENSADFSGCMLQPVMPSISVASFTSLSEVNEKGTGYGTTAVVMAVLATMPFTLFAADKPFLVLIHDATAHSFGVDDDPNIRWRLRSRCQPQSA